ncbi:MAG: PQQ-binding-like beta-propeller repeat protein, partial [Acidimicrobiia bacterium]
GLDDGIDDRVSGFEGATLAGDRVVVSGLQADLVVVGSDGTELVRRPGGVGIPIGIVGGLVVLAGYDHAAAIGPTTGETAWVSSRTRPGSLVISDDTLWLLDAPAGTVSRLDPQTGDSLWTTPVGITNGFDVAVDASTAYIATSLAMIALDLSTGELEWWQHLPFEHS